MSSSMKKERDYLSQVAAALVSVSLLVAGLVAMGFGLTAANASDVCSGLSSGKIDTTGDPASVTATAPDGKLISGYCVKAGSSKQGDGPVYVEVTPPQKSVTISYQGGKAISHYSVSYTEGAPPSPSPSESDSPSPPPAQCDDGSNPGDANGDGEANEADCNYTPPPSPSPSESESDDPAPSPSPSESDSPPVDVCTNIPGNQSEVPPGYEDPDGDGICTKVTPSPSPSESESDDPSPSPSPSESDSPSPSPTETESGSPEPSDTPTGGVCTNLTGSVKTTLPDGSVVNGNIYPNKESVYVYGDHLGDVTKVFIRVTGPDGSPTYPASAVKEVAVTNGTFGPVQLPAFGDTPNNGGEYKVWVSTSADFENNCTKTDNFKVRVSSPSPSPSESDSPGPSPTDTSSPTVTPTTASPTGTPTTAPPSPTVSASPSASVSPSPSVSSSPSQEPSPSQSVEPTTSPEPTKSPSTKPSSSAQPKPTTKPAPTQTVKPSSPPVQVVPTAVDAGLAGYDKPQGGTGIQLGLLLFGLSCVVGAATMAVRGRLYRGKHN